VGDRQGEATTLVNIGVLALEAGRFQEAREPFEQALRILEEVGGRGNQANALGYLGRIEAAVGDPGRARAKLEQALALKRQVSDQAGEATMLYHLARLARDQGDLPQAQRRAEEAVGRVESMRTGLRSAALRASYTASVREIYELYIDVLTRLHEREPGAGRDVESLRASERARARALLDLLLESRADIREGADPGLRERERTLHERLTLKLDRQLRLLSRTHTPEQAEAAAREIDALTAEYDDVRARLRRASPHYAALTQPAPPELADIQRRLLDADTILLEYALGRERSTLWAVTDETFSLFTLPAGTRIEETARKAAELLALRDPGPAGQKELKAALGALSEMLLAPVAGALGNRRVVVVPDGALYYVPFAALPDPRSPARPLLARHEVVALPSAAVLAVLREELGHRRPAPKTLAVLADPVFDARDERLTGGGPPPRTTSAERDVDRAARAAGLEGGLPRLPFTRREAQAILALVPRGARKEALDFDASRATATAPDLGEYRFLHFATHGFLNASRPELSGIVLSLVDRRGRDQNGFLAAPEVFNLRLGADMVVLSGCRTGLGRELRGEGLVGLTRAFMYAGTPRVLASLWKVDDAATAELMTRLYRGLLERRLSPSAALREAQLALAGTRRWRSPYFWASFQMHGDWKGPDR
jgi:CHAT domain-containing protein